MSQENTAIARNLYQAFARGDMPAVLGTLDPKIEWNEAESFLYADGNPYIGVPAVLEGVFMRLGADWEGFAVSAHDILDAGDRVVGLGYYTGTYRKNARQIRAQFAHVFTIRNGKITKFQQYTDTAKFTQTAVSN